MEEILQKAVEQIPALVIFAVFAIALYRFQAAERESRDIKWREFLTKESEIRNDICNRYVESSKVMGDALGKQSIEFSSLRKAVARQTAALLYTISQKESNGDKKMGMRELVELLLEGIK